MNKFLKCIAAFTASIALFSAFASCKKGDDPVTPDEGKKEEIPFTDVSLSENGVSGYKIVIPANATAPEKFAAEELKNIFYNSTGADLEVVSGGDYTQNDKVISIGDTSVFKTLNVNLSEINFNYDGYILKRAGNAVVINASEENGKINGVYGFCEKNLGYMYYAQDCVKYGNFKNATVKLRDFDLIDVPDFEGRIAFSAEVIADGLHRLRLKNNNQGTNWFEKYGNEGLWSELHDQSITMQIVNAAKYYGEHKNWYYVPEERKAEAEELLVPQNEEFSYQGDVWTLIKESVQICYHEALASKGKQGGLYETFLNNLINNYIAKETDKRLFMLGMSDNEEICNCSECTEDNAQYTVTGTCMRFVNEIAKDVEKWRLQNCPEREINLVVFAYLSTQDAPVKRGSDGKYAPADPSVIAEENVVVRIAPIHSCHYYTFDNKDKNSLSARMFENWRMCAKRFAIWDYKMSFEYKIVPFPTWNSAQHNIKMYKEMGVIDILTQGNNTSYNTSLGRMDDWIRSRLMWDCEQSYQTLADEFIENYYGEASEYMKDYLAYLEMHYAAVLEKKTNFNAIIYTSLLSSNYWPKETLLNIEGIFNNAYNVINGLPDSRKAELKTRIDRESAFYRFALIELYGADIYTADQLKKAIDDYIAISDVAMARPYKNETTIDFVLKWKSRYGVE